MAFFKSIAITLFLFGFNSVAEAQWTIIPTGTTQDIYSVDYFNLNEIYLGSVNRMIYSINGGSSWTTVSPLIDQNGLPVNGNFYDIKKSANGTLVATGLITSVNTEHILTSVNNGVTWNDIQNPQAGPATVREVNAIARNNNAMIAVADHGRIAGSSNAGTTWSFYNPAITDHALDVEFLSNDTVFAVGSSRVWRSTDAGSTWNTWPLPGYHSTISASSGYVYVSNESSAVLLKSSDNGSSFTNINLPFVCSGAIYAINNDSILAASDSAIYISASGGQYWQKLILPSYQQVNMFGYLNGSLIAVGKSGYAIRTPSIATASTLPVAKFDIQNPGPYCQGGSIVLNNTSGNYPGYTFKWKIDGIAAGNQYNFIYNLNMPGVHILSLTVTNQNGSSTYSEQVVVTGHNRPHFVLKAESDTICSGSYITYTVPNSKPGVIYQLRSGYTSIGAPQSGNGGTLSFINNSPLALPASFNIIALSVNNCFTDSIVKSDSVFISSSLVIASCIPATSHQSGITNFTLNTINNSTAAKVSEYSDFTCQHSTSLIPGHAYPFSISATANGGFRVWVDLDNDGIITNAESLAQNSTNTALFNATITIPVTQLIYNQKLRLRIGFTAAGPLSDPCGSNSNGEYEDYAVTILYAPVVPGPSFNFSITAGCNTDVSFTNNTVNASGYSWDFGDGITSTDTHPVHTYSVGGNYTVTLTAYNPTGQAMSTQQLQIQTPVTPVPASCNLAGFYDPGASPKFRGITLNGLNTNTTQTTFYADYTCLYQIHLTRDSTYSLTTKSSGSPNCGWIGIWVDWDGDGVFQDPADRLYSAFAAVCPSWNLNFTVPSTAVPDIPLRMRFVVSKNTFNNPCAINISGQYQEYTLIVDSIAKPTPAFTANFNSVCVNTVVQFTNTTSGNVSSTWDFGDGTTSSLTSPAHAYAVPGNYTVTLKVCDSTGSCDSLIRSSFIQVQQEVFNRQEVICQGSNIVVGSHTYTIPGFYSDTLTSVSGCDSIINLQLYVSSIQPLAISASGPVTFCKGDSVTLSAPVGLAGWQWYRNNYALAGENKAFYTTKVPGQYYCAAYDSAVCGAISNTIIVAVPCIRSIQPGLRIGEGSEVISISPNPANGEFLLTSPGGNLMIADQLGRIVRNQRVDGHRDVIDLFDLQPGIYSVVLNTGTEIYREKLLLTDR